MSEPKFSYNEAISHGWQMTKKHWKILALATISPWIELVHGFSGGFAGTRDTFSEIYKDPEQVKRLMLDLVKNGYNAV